MSIQCHFSLGSERIIIRIIQDNILFVDLKTNMMSPIEGLKLNKEGVIKEHPDLKDDVEWKQKAIQRFVNRIKGFNTEMERMDFMIKEMREMGYTPLLLQRDGFRPTKIK